jgi:hypothetical protein
VVAAGQRIEVAGCWLGGAGAVCRPYSTLYGSTALRSTALLRLLVRLYGSGPRAY